jgi:hypothetical protein
MPKKRWNDNRLTHKTPENKISNESKGLRAFAQHRLTAGLHVACHYFPYVSG